MKRTLFIFFSGIISISLFILLCTKFPLCTSFIFNRIVAFKSSHGAYNKVVPGKDGWLFLQPELDYVVRPLPRENIRLIAAFNRTLAEHGMTLYVAPIPNKIDVYPERLTAIAAPHPVSKCRKEFLAHLRHVGVRVIDVLPALVNAKSTRLVFDPYESHWTSEGIVAAAEVIARAIDSNLTALRISHNVGYTVHDTILMGCADLPAKLKGEDKAFWYPTPVKQVQNPDGHLYTDDKKSEILILGDSFVDHGRSWSVNLGAQLARLIGHPTRTYSSLLANTEGPSMYDRLPSIFPKNGIVIWAFASRVLQYRMCIKQDSGI
jgi:hypothetical protein